MDVLLYRKNGNSIQRYLEQGISWRKEAISSSITGPLQKKNNKKITLWLETGLNLAWFSIYK